MQSRPHRPSIYLIGWLPAVAKQPLELRERQQGQPDTNGFVVHRWGAVAVINSNQTQLTKADLQPTIQTWHASLRELLGVTLVTDDQTNQDIQWLYDDVTGLAKWELHRWQRNRLVDAADRLGYTLRALVSMVERISTLPVPDEVSQLVAQALQKHDDAKRLAKTGDSIGQAARSATEGLELATLAFRHPAMVSLLYFPDEHKLAVYLPYFLPVLMPLARGLVAEVKAWKQSKLAQNTKDD